MSVELRALLKILADVRDLKRASHEVNTFHKNLFSVKNLLKGGLGLAGATLGLRAIGNLQQMTAALPRNIVQANIEWEKSIQVFRAISGSQSEANRLYDLSVQKARFYGQEIGVVSGSLSRMMAASNGTNLAGQDTIDIWESLLEAGTVLNLNGQEMEGVFRAVEQMISKGNVSAEELRGQMGERLPGAFQIAARAMGVTTQELDGMLKKGEVTAEDMLPKLAAELHNTFGPDVQTATQSTSAKVNRLHTELALMFQTLGKSGFMDTFSESVSDLGDAFQDPEFQSSIQNIAKFMGVIAEKTLKMVEATGKAIELYDKLPETVKKGITFSPAGSIVKQAKGEADYSTLGGVMSFSPAGFLWNKLFGDKNTPGTGPQPPSPSTSAAQQVTQPPTGTLPEYNVNEFDSLGFNKLELARTLLKQRQLETNELTTQAEKHAELNQLTDREFATRQAIVNELSMQIAAEPDMKLEEQLSIYQEMETHFLRIAQIQNEQKPLGKLDLDKLALAQTLYKQRLLETDELTTQASKQAELNALAEEEFTLRQDIVRELTQANADNPDGNLADKLSILKEIEEHQIRLAELQNEKETQTFGGGFQASLVDWKDSLEVTGEEVGGILTGGIDAALESTSQSLSNLIFKTGDWGQTFQRIGQNIVASLIQIGIQEAALYALRRIFKQQDTQATISEEAQKAPLLQSNAAAASISSYGGAAISGLALALLAIGGITAALAFRERGGPVTAGKPYIVGEKRPEVFVPSQSGMIVPSVDQFLGAQESAATQAAVLPAGGQSPVPSRPQRAEQPPTAFFDDRQAMADWIESQDFEVRVVHIMRGNRGELING